MSNPEETTVNESRLKDFFIIGGLTVVVLGLFPLLAVCGLALQAGFVVVAPVLVLGTLSYALFTRAEPSLELIHGITLPSDVCFHKAHTWARRAAKNCMVVGIDDLARRLVDQVDDVEIRPAGTEVSRGQVVGVIRSGNRELPIVAPMDGRISQVNPVLQKEPNAMLTSPYNRGWLFEMAAPRAALKGLMRGERGLRWMHREVDRLASLVGPTPVTVALPDGAVLADDIGAALDDRNWQNVVNELVLSKE